VSDQLSLSLTGDVARLPHTLRPMMPRSAEAPFNSSDHVFEPNWGGRRVLAFIEPGRPGKPNLRLLDENGRDLAPHLPELAYIAELVGEPPAILDGELVVPDKNGRMDQEALVGRLADGQTTGLSPVYLVFDLLWAGGRPLVAQPLVKRRERLAKSVTTASSCTSRSRSKVLRGSWPATCAARICRDAAATCGAGFRHSPARCRCAW
jgi:ATP-dependent DNA ligase